ncbi:MAG: AAA family ATPase, partial [Planctomycetes bacterium]|nr:AAA family ATPase [Planctomycetota bacterium]
MTEEEQLEQSRRRILALRSDLYRYFVGKNEIIDLMTIAAIAQEPLLLVG